MYMYILGLCSISVLVTTAVLNLKQYYICLVIKNIEYWLNYWNCGIYNSPYRGLNKIEQGQHPHIGQISSTCLHKSTWPCSTFSSYESFQSNYSIHNMSSIYHYNYI